MKITTLKENTKEKQFHCPDNCLLCRIHSVNNFLVSNGQRNPSNKEKERHHKIRQVQAIPWSMCYYWEYWASIVHKHHQKDAEAAENVKRSNTRRLRYSGDAQRWRRAMLVARRQSQLQLLLFIVVLERRVLRH
uniref:Uncharacterized protein n=1 Tax=Opuntia streptacantha TaxID=393608 RepID=A0A7C8ZGT9_OPUST